VPFRMGQQLPLYGVTGFRQLGPCKPVFIRAFQQQRGGLPEKPRTIHLHAKSTWRVRRCSHYHPSMRTLLLFLALLAAAAPSSADEWTSRSGNCFEWEALWTVQRDASGAWVGSIDFQHVGGSCTPPNNNVMTGEVRAATIGEDFYARIVLGAAGSCLANGRIQGAEVRGFLLCHGSAHSLTFALRFNKN
jgi:hypothetical protein